MARASPCSGSVIFRAAGARGRQERRKTPKKSLRRTTYCRTLIDQHNELWAQVCPAIGHHPCTIALDAYRLFRVFTVFGIGGREFVWALRCPLKLAILCEKMPVAPTSGIWQVVIPFVRSNVR